MARPRKGEEKNAKAVIGLRLPPDLRACIEKLAQKHDRPLSDEIRVALENHCARIKLK